jgi:hypothetical protein
LHQGVALGEEELRVVGLELQSVVAGGYIGEACAAELIPLELRALGGLGEAFDVRLLGHEAAHVAELARQLSAAGEGLLAGFEDVDGLLVASLIHQRVC